MGLGVARGTGLGVARAARKEVLTSASGGDAAAPAPRCATPPEAEVKASFPARASAQKASAASSRVELIIMNLRWKPVASATGGKRMPQARAAVAARGLRHPL